jgi:acetoacetyl-CoA reductase
MPRNALVTGGNTRYRRGNLQSAPGGRYKVAANYGGNDEAAQKFRAETGIPVYKWDVSSFEACAAGIKQVEAALGPVDILVNNAGITRDAQLHRMKPEQWTQYFLDQRPEGPVRADQLFGRQGRRDWLHKALAQECARVGITVNAIAPGYINTEMVQAVPKDVLENSILPTIPIGRPRRTGKDRALRRISGRRRCRPDHRLDAHR